MAKGRPKKDFQEYLCESTDSHISHGEYLKSPGTAFLRHTVEAKSAIDLCIRQLPHNTNGTHTKSSRDTIQHLTLALLPTVMGHFETYQRYLFARMFDFTVYLKDFKVKPFIDTINKEAKTEITIDLERLAAFRGVDLTSIGLVVSDNLKGWHKPEKVNIYFNAFGFEHQIFSKDAIKKLNVLWQLRHSIVHTGGTITLPDSGKVKELQKYGGKSNLFENNFIYEVARKLHPIIKNGTEGLGTKFKSEMKANVNSTKILEIEKFFEVKSSIGVWLK